MISVKYVITAMGGLQARPAATLVRLCKNYRSNIVLKKGERIILLNSILNLLSLPVKGGDLVSLHIDGEDEADAMLALDAFFKDELLKIY